LRAAPGQPSGASKLCLSCHDGTIALGAVWNRTEEIPFVDDIRLMPDGKSKLGTDLSDDHPVSIGYQKSAQPRTQSTSSASRFESTRRPGQNLTPAELRPKSTLPSEIQLDPSGQIQCTSCHDPHEDTNGSFLVLPQQRSTLCLACHEPLKWELSSHAISNAKWNGAPPSPWAGSRFATVAANGCESCHRSHTAGSPQRLLKYRSEEDNCLACHNGNVAAQNISRELTKMSSHPVQNFLGLHDPTERHPSSIAVHVECADCHQSHQVKKGVTKAPSVPDTLGAVPGVSATGSYLRRVTNAYEICFKCHADFNVVRYTSIPRQIPELNTRLEFDLSNPSYHPVEGPGVNRNVPSLLSPYSTNSVIYCTDCHSNVDGRRGGGQGPNGPHGSDYPYLLERNYETRDNTPESSTAYALCYKCHDRDVILDENRSPFREHKRHVQDERAPCSVCHDPHGINGSRGTSANNSYLINFDLTVVQPSQKTGLLLFEDMGNARGQCYLTCHGKDHDAEGYN
jgi:predicted CXXCH cytochrome family protein